MPKTNGISEFFKNFTPGNLVFDIGAHTGTYTDRYLALGARVVCVDPQPWCVDQLNRKYVNIHGIYIEGVGVSDKPGEAWFTPCDQFPTLSTFSLDWKTKGRFSGVGWGESVKTPVTTLDILIHKYGLPVYIKIDVEGYELQVLQGLNHKIDLISLEFTWEFRQTAAQCVDRLQELGYTGFDLSLGDDGNFVFNQMVDGETVKNWLLNQPDSQMWGDIYAQ